MNTEFHLADGVFVKQIHIPKADSFVPQHSHHWDHTSFLARGAMYLWKDGVLDKLYKAPCGIFIKAGVKHTFLTIEDDTIIYCIHYLHGAPAVAVLEEHELSLADLGPLVSQIEEGDIRSL